MQQYIKLKLTIEKITVKMHKVTVRQTNRNTEIKRVYFIGVWEKLWTGMDSAIQSHINYLNWPRTNIQPYKRLNLIWLSYLNWGKNECSKLIFHSKCCHLSGKNTGSHKLKMYSEKELFINSMKNLLLTANNVQRKSVDNIDWDNCFDEP